MRGHSTGQLEPADNNISGIRNHSCSSLGSDEYVASWIRCNVAGGKAMKFQQQRTTMTTIDVDDDVKRLVFTRMNAASVLAVSYAQLH